MLYMPVLWMSQGFFSSQGLFVLPFCTRRNRVTAVWYWKRCLKRKNFLHGLVIVFVPRWVFWDYLYWESSWWSQCLSCPAGIVRGVWQAVLRHQCSPSDSCISVLVTSSRLQKAHQPGAGAGVSSDTTWSHQRQLALCSEWTTHAGHLHFAVMPNPPSPGYHALTEHGRLHLSAPHLSSLPQPCRLSRLLCSACCHLTFTGQLGTTIPVVPSCSHQLRSQGREAQGWLLAGRTLPLLSSHPRLEAEQSRAWAALYISPSSQTPGTLWSCSPWSPPELWDRSR